MSAPKFSGKFLRYGLIGMAISLSACNKDEEVPSRVGLLTAHTWHLDALSSTPAFPATINGRTQYFTDIFEEYRAEGNQCLLDEHLTFAIGDILSIYRLGAYHFQGGQPGCSPKYQTVDWNWFIDDTSTGKTMIYLQDGGTMPYGGVIKSTLTVQELSSKRLIMSAVITTTPGNRTYTYLYTLSAE